MKLLLDSQILVAIAHNQSASLPAIQAQLQSPTNQMFVSVASLWEIAIKFRLGKLLLPRPPAALAVFFQALGYRLIAIDHRHAVEDLRDQPATRDPFDRLLLAQCQVESLLLVTTDRALAAHPLAWKAPQATCVPTSRPSDSRARSAP